MKIKFAPALLIALGLLISATESYAADITATGSGNWSSTIPDMPWPGGIVPSTNDSVDIEPPYSVTVDTNTTVSYIYGDGAVTMASGVTLTVVGDTNGAYGAQQLATLNATAPSNTVVYLGNTYWAKRTDYYNLVFANFTTNAYDFFNGVIPGYGAQPMSITGDMSVSGKIKVQQGADISILGSLTLGTNSTWDCSSFKLTVLSNTTINGLLLDLDGALGSNYFAGNMTINPYTTSGGWNVSDVTQWAVGGNLTNNGTIAGGKGYGSISFDGNGTIAGKTFKIPTITVNGSYKIASTIILTTNTPTLNGTLIFDLANTNQLVLQTYATNPITLYYNSILNVINTGAPPTPGHIYKFFVATNYDGAFSSTTYPSGTTWTDNLLTSGSITAMGSAGAPTLSLLSSGVQLTLSWDSTTYPGYSVVAQTNADGLGANWSPTGSGTVSPFHINVDPTKPAVFFRLSHP